MNTIHRTRLFANMQANEETGSNMDAALEEQHNNLRLRSFLEDPSGRLQLRLNDLYSWFVPSPGEETLETFDRRRAFLRLTTATLNNGGSFDDVLTGPLQGEMLAANGESLFRYMEGLNASGKAIFRDNILYISNLVAAYYDPINA